MTIDQLVLRQIIFTLSFLVLLALLVGCGQQAPSALDFSHCESNNPDDYFIATKCLSDEVEDKINQGADPRSVIPRVDQASLRMQSPVRSLCHIAMHKVGRDFATKNKVTLTNLQDYLPPSNSQQCAAGFTHGMISIIGIDKKNASQLLAICAKEPTRARQAACAHGIGHGLRRTIPNDDNMGKALAVCQSLGRKALSDCAQGIFHDFYIAAQGQDDQAQPVNARNQRRLCQTQPGPFQAPCWYRTFTSIEMKIAGAERTTPPLDRVKLACGQLSGNRRYNCIQGLATIMIPLPELVDSCARLNNRDAQACISGAYLLAPGSEAKPLRGQALIDDRRFIADELVKCVKLPGNKAQDNCFYWLAYYSIRAQANAVDKRAARLACAKLYGKAGQLCNRGLDDSQNNDLGPVG